MVIEYLTFNLTIWIFAQVSITVQLIITIYEPTSGSTPFAMDGRLARTQLYILDNGRILSIIY